MRHIRMPSIQVATPARASIVVGMEWTEISALIDDRVDEGVFSVHRAAFTNEDLFEHELAHVFGGGWVFLGMACQAANPHDFFTTTIGRTPIVVMRDGKGNLGAFVNSCTHKGAMICHTRQGHGRVHVCPYHSWSFDSAGRSIAVKAQKAGGYSKCFEDTPRDLARLPAFADYRGFLFGSLVETCPIEEHLGEARHFLDLAADQGEDGLELVPGEVIFTYDGNWKMQLENCADPYHFTSVHPSYVRLIEKRNAEKTENAVRSVWGKDAAWSEMTGGITGGTYAFDEGHVVNWQVIPLSDAVPLGGTGGSTCRALRCCAPRLDGQYAQPDDFPQYAIGRKCVEPVADHAAAVCWQDRNANILHRAQGRERRRTRTAHPQL